MRAVVGLFLAVGLTGCLDPSPVVPVTEVCSAICACRSPLPHTQEICTADCEAELAGVLIPDACVTCAQVSACFELDDCLSTCAAVPSPEEP